MAYERQPHPRRWELEYEGDGPGTTLRYTFVLDGKETRPTSAKIAIDNSGGTALVASTAMTLESSPSASLTYQVDASDTDDYPLGEGYKATIVTTYSSETYTDTIWFDVVRRPLWPTLRDDGLLELEQELGLYKDTGEVDWSKKIEAAWGRIVTRLRQKANQDGQIRPALIVGYDQLYETHRLWTCELIFRDRQGEGEGNLLKAEYYEAQRIQELDAALASLTYSVGDAEDPGAPEPDNFAGITLTR